MQKISADRIYTLESTSYLTDHVIIIDDKGVIIDITPKSVHDQSTVKHHHGIICPGFINTHCHLELSHMKGLVDTGTGLLPFLQSVVQYRDFPEDTILQAIKDGDAEMRADGIVAVGDISNKIDTAATKSSSDIRYHTFVEMFDFMQASMTSGTIAQYQDVYAGQSSEGHNKKSYAPHAPYTVSDDLYKFIAAQEGKDFTVSIHNQETLEEGLLFKNKSGGFMDFYKGFGFSLDGFRATGKSSIHHAMEHMNHKHRTIFVHNTMTTADDITAAKAWNDRVYWATCPNANLYIENRLPDYKLFVDADAKMTIGTDSLTSNWQLSILEEIKTIHRYKSYLDLDTLLTWACKNGAEALGYEQDLGSIKVGKQPGLVLLTGIDLVADKLDLSKAESSKLV